MPSDKAAVYKAMVRPRTRSLLSSLVQVSDITNKASAPIPKPRRSGNHIQTAGANGKKASSEAVKIKATTTSFLAPNLTARNGSIGAITSTPAACMAAFRPI